MFLAVFTWQCCTWVGVELWIESASPSDVQELESESQNDVDGPSPVF